MTSTKALQSFKLSWSSYSSFVQFLFLVKCALLAASLISLILNFQNLFTDLSIPEESRLSFFALITKYWSFGLILILTLISWVFSWKQSISEDSAYIELNILHGPYGLDLMQDMALSEEKNNSSRTQIKTYGLEAGWTNNDLNKALLEADIEKRSLGYGVLPSVWKAYESSTDNIKSRLNQKMRYALRRKLRTGTKITNDTKIRLASEIRPDLNSPIQIQQTDYLSSLMTDQMAFRRVYAKKDNDTVLHHGTNDFIKIASGHSRLATIPEAVLVSNQIGASTLAFTKDGLITIVYQTKQNSQSRDRLAPSGSGSLDWEDLGPQRTGSFLDVVKRGATRELIEECGLIGKINPDIFMKEALYTYGFSRMVHRAGKPEFFCIAVLPFTSAEINSFQVDNKEIPFTEKTANGDLPPLDWEGDLATSLPKICKFYSDPLNRTLLVSNTKALGLSYPLRHGLDLLADLLEQNPGLSKKLAKQLKIARNQPQAYFLTS